MPVPVPTYSRAPSTSNNNIIDSPWWHEQQNASSLAEKVGSVLPNPTPPLGTKSMPVHVPTYSRAPSTSNSLGSDKPFPPHSPGIRRGMLPIKFTYEELKMATDNFSKTNFLGEGGFGDVHKGDIPNVGVVAIKQLKAGSRQGEREFQAEVEIISHVHHKHLVSLVGYCISGAQSLLVYEFVPNKTLEFHLHGGARPAMDWPTRMKIALGSARGLAYLHEDCDPKIIHRDIKSTNILIDNSFKAKVADFGLAKYFLDTDAYTRVMGTPGYLAPEYAASGKLTDKIDVFSFGVLLVELITGRRPFGGIDSNVDDSMAGWARPLFAQAMENRNFTGLVDPRLITYNPVEMHRMVACAATSIRHSAEHRPSMGQIVRVLEGNMSVDDLNGGIPPGQSSEHGGSKQEREGMKKSREAGQESIYISSEFSGFKYAGSQSG